MIKFRDILKLSQPYHLQRVQFVLYNILTAIFNVFSIGMLIPFLKVIFDEKRDMAEVAFSWNPEQFISFLNYKLNSWIMEWGDYQALIYFSLAIVAAFLLKNLFLYLSFYNLAYIRSAVVKDIRMDIFKHMF